MNNILFCSVGRRGCLLRNARRSIGESGTIVATDNNATAPALYFADKRYVVPKITDPEYIGRILEICRLNDIKAVTTLIDPEIEILAGNREIFLQNGILPLCPDRESAHRCFDKYELFRFLRERGIRTVPTYRDLDEFKSELEKGAISFPVFIKPVCGSGSVGAHKVQNMEELESDWFSGEHDYIIQELMTGGDCDADVYVDSISHKAVAAFSKRKIETRIGGASKTVSFKDPKLFDFIREIVEAFDFCGPLDMDFFIKNGEYYLSEINPRFGGAYLHAYGAGVDFFEMIANNISGKENEDRIGLYDEDILMMMYDDVVIKRKSELAGDTFSVL